MTKELFIDIETIPAQSQAAQERILSNLKAPGNYKKPEAIEAWMAENTPDAIAKSSLNGAYGHICCIGFAFDDEEVSTVSWPLQHETEKEALRYFAQFISTVDRAPILVGHHIIGFDLRFITQRCMALGVRLPKWWPTQIKPWTPDIYDTMLEWAGHNNYISMDDLCFALGLEGKGAVDGSMVGQMWTDGKHQEIIDYQIDDVEKVRAVYRKMRYPFGYNNVPKDELPF